jgi:hypothetical protein
MKKRIPTLVSLAILLGVWCAAPARATTLVRLSLEQLSQASSAIVRGHVVSEESGWNPAHTHIFTTTTVAVDQTLKGNAQPEVVIEQLGGKLGHRREYVSGTVHFFPQASYWLFLEPAAAGARRYMVVGMAQGAYRIYQDPATREERVIRPFGGVFYGTRGPEQATQGGAPPLQQFRQAVSAALQAPIVIPKGTSLPVLIEAARSRGVGRLSVLGRTTADVFPSRTVVVPSGSEVEGTAERVAGTWRILWTGVSIRGARVEIAGASSEPATEHLGGKLVVIRVR